MSFYRTWITRGRFGRASRTRHARRMSCRHFSALTRAMGLFLGGLGGCASEPPGNALLSSEATVGIREAMESAADEVAAADNIRQPFSLSAAGQSGRWEDIELAVIWAVDEAGIEMAMLDKHEFPWGTIFELRTVEGWPARLVVEKKLDDAGEVMGIENRAAEVGRFPDQPERQSRARRLEEGFDRWLAAFGRKRVPAVEPSGSE